MAKHVAVIGIGPGDPDEVTVRAVRALNRASVVFFPAKRADHEDLLRFRYEVCARHVTGAPPRVVEIPDPARSPSPGGHRATVERWYEQRDTAWEAALSEHLADGETGAFLAWGDPTLYDGTLRVLDAIRARGAIDLEVEVVPGISAVQALVAAHRITLNQVGGSVVITTGRELKAAWAAAVDDVVVMLDPHCAFRDLGAPETAIYWGAYLGAPEEILISGTVEGCEDAIADARAAARERRGWVFDTYLLRRARPA